MHARQIPLEYSLGSIVGPALISACFNYLFFLLCGLLFKRHKILNAILVMMAVSTVFSLIAPHLLPDFAARVEGMNEVQAATFADGFFTVVTLVTGLFAALLAAGCFYRIRKIAH